MARNLWWLYSQTISIKYKRLYFDTQSDYIVLDTAGNGISVLDELGEYTTDVERGIVYPPLKAMNDENMKNVVVILKHKIYILC